ncbi:MAG: LamG domain-containing protein, partial [Candidatus Bathyarchaeia archaeon]
MKKFKTVFLAFLILCSTCAIMQPPVNAHPDVPLISYIQTVVANVNWSESIDTVYMGYVMGQKTMDDLVAAYNALPLSNYQQIDTFWFWQAVLKKYGIENSTKIKQALDATTMLANGLPQCTSETGGPAFHVGHRGIFQGFYYANLYNYQTSKWNVTNAYASFKTAVYKASYPAVLWVYGDNTSFTVSYGPRFYDEGAETFDCFLSFYELGIDSALDDAKYVWDWINNNLWIESPAHYEYARAWADFECEAGGFLSLAEKLWYTYPTLGNISRTMTDIINRFLTNGWLSPQWSIGSTPYFCVVHHNPGNSERRLQNTIMAWAAILGLYDRYSEDVKTFVKNLIGGYSSYPYAAWQYLYGFSGLYSNGYFTWLSGTATSNDATAAGSCLLLLNGILPVSGSIAVPLEEYCYEYRYNILDGELLRINLTAKTLVLPVMTPGTINFLYNATVSGYFAESGIYQVQFSNDWNTIVSIAKISSLPANREYVGQPNIKMAEELNPVFAYDMASLLVDSDRRILLDSSKYKNYAVFDDQSKVPTVTQGALGFGLYFDGNKYGWVQSSESMPPYTLMTISAWVYMTSDSVLNQHVIYKPGSYSLETFYGNFTFSVMDTSGYWYRAISNVKPELNRWYFILGELNATHVNIYVDNQIAGSVQFGMEPMSNTNNVLIGYTWSGIIDELQGYHRVLSSTEKTLVQKNQIPAPSDYIFTSLSSTSTTSALMDYYNTGDNMLLGAYGSNW